MGDQGIEDAGLVVAGLLDRPDQQGLIIEETVAIRELVEEEVPIRLRIVIGKARRDTDKRNDRFREPEFSPMILQGKEDVCQDV